jgi:hypothetical protein
MPVIPATWEAEIGESRFEASPGKKSELLSQKAGWAWSCMTVIPATQERQVRRSRSEASLGIFLSGNVKMEARFK